MIENYGFRRYVGAHRREPIIAAWEQARMSVFVSVPNWVWHRRSLLAPEGYAEERPVTPGIILLIVLVLMLVGAIPRWRYSQNWGYVPSGGLGFVLIVVVIVLLLGRL
jgi:hypothetical protein